MTDARFWSKVDRSGGPDACWPWTEGKFREGYGSYHLPRPGPTVLAHRYAWEQVNGLIPDGAHVDHECHNGTGCPGGSTCPHRLCCNPAHLEPTTCADNIDRSHLANAHKTHCPADHEYTPENTYLRPPRRPGHRVRRLCRTCNRDRARARARRQTPADPFPSTDTTVPPPL